MSTKTTQGKEGEMTTQNDLEENKRIVRAFIETAFNQHQADRAADEGTHKGDLLGIPASDRHVRWDAVDVYRVADGKIAEEWAADDLLAFVYGVGAYTPPWMAQQS